MRPEPTEAPAAELPYRVLVDQMRDGALSLASDGTILFANRRFAELVGLSPDQIAGTTIYRFIPFKDVRAFDAIVARRGNGDVELWTTTGRLTPIRVAATAVSEPEGAACVLVTDVTRQRRQPERPHADELVQAMLDHAEDAVVVCDGEGRVLRANPGAQALASGELLLRSFDELFPLHDPADGALLPFAQLCGSGRASRREAVLRHRDGRRLAVRVDATPFEGQEGGSLGCVISLVDIGRRGRAEDAVRHSQSRYQTLFDATSDGILIIDDQGISVDANESLCRMLKLSRDQVLGTHFARFVPPDRLPAAHAGFGRLKTAGELSDEFALRAADGTLVELEWRSRAEFLPGLHLCVARDITPRLRAERELRRREAEFRAMFELAGVGKAQVDAETGRFLRANATLCELLGYPEAELLRMSWFDATHPDDRAMCWDGFGRMVRGERPQLTCEARCVRRDGAVLWTEITVSVVRDGDGRAMSAVAVIQDISTRKQFEEQARLREHQLRKYNTVVLELAKAASSPQDPATMWRTILTAAARSLRVARASVWLFDADRALLVCLCAYDQRSDEVSSGQRLAVAQFPAYFQALERERMIAANDAEEDPRTREFTADYLRPAGVRAMLDAPIRRRGQIVGVVCHEHVEEPRVWSIESQHFAASVADVIALALESAERRGLAEEVTRLNRDLQERVTELQTIMDVIPIGLSVGHDPRCEAITVNPTFAELTGRQPYRVYRDGRELPATELPMQVAAARGVKITGFECEVRMDDGRAIHLLVNAAPLLDADGRVRGCIAAHIDITERKQSEERVKASLREKEVLLKEIHHRVKNNLQIISSLLSLQADRLTDPDAVRLLQDSQDRIRSMALVHERLYAAGNLSRIDMCVYVQTLVEQLLISYRNSPGVQADVHAQPVWLDIDAAIPCGLILNELVSNALKHAFPDGRPGRIVVSLEPLGLGARLSVRDNGVGLPANVRPERADSLGLRLVQALSEQLHASLQIEPGPGACFVIEFTAAPSNDRP
jgi:PAS domain S-box-containing protein